MKVYVAVTDNEWLAFLSQIEDLDEVNFWQPGGRRLTRLDIGQPVLFKLHAPLNNIAGGALFSHGSKLPVSLAWDAFGEKNGARSFSEMRRRIERYRRIQSDPREDYTIGCLLMRDPFFLPQSDWVPVPAEFHPSIQQGKNFSLTASPGRELWETVLERRRGLGAAAVSEPSRPMYGEPVQVRPRLGQGTFRVLVTDTYRRRCAVTAEKALPALQAAHIRPVSEGGVHRLDNGLLLRSDVHALFDHGYVTVTPDLRFRASKRLREDFDNGEYYVQLSGGEIWIPRNEGDRPAKELLEWHADTIFLG